MGRCELTIPCALWGVLHRQYISECEQESEEKSEGEMTAPSQGVVFRVVIEQGRSIEPSPITCGERRLWRASDVAGILRQSNEVYC